MSYDLLYYFKTTTLLVINICCYICFLFKFKRQLYLITPYSEYVLCNIIVPTFKIKGRKKWILQNYKK